MITLIEKFIAADPKTVKRFHYVSFRRRKFVRRGQVFTFVGLSLVRIPIGWRSAATEGAIPRRSRQNGGTTDGSRFTRIKQFVRQGVKLELTTRTGRSKDSAAITDSATIIYLYFSTFLW